MSYWSFKNLQIWLVKSKLGITDQNQLILIEWEHFWVRKIKNVSEYIWGGFPIRKQRLQVLSFKIIYNTLKLKTFSRNLISCIFQAFFNRYEPWFLYIFSHCKMSEKCKIFEIRRFKKNVKLPTAGQRGSQTDKKQILYTTTTLHAGLINQEDNDCFWGGCFDPNLSTIASSPNF